MFLIFAVRIILLDRLRVHILLVRLNKILVYTNMVENCCQDLTIFIAGNAGMRMF
jgi:hypothetical protein